MAENKKISNAGPGQPPPDVRGKSTAGQKIGRDAKSGQFVSAKEVQRRPSTTIVETIKKTTPASKGKNK